MLVQLPNDAVATGYTQTRPYHYEQVFHSPSCGFTGTERDFVLAGFGYAYTQLDAHSRVVCPTNR